jgi:hypothetical protein
MAGSNDSGAVLTLADIDEAAVRIGAMWDNYNTERRQALLLNEEARKYVFGTDIDKTNAAILPHKNRTHQPKLTQISDNLQSQYFEASLSMPMFFMFQGATPADKEKARKVSAWVRTKLETKKFRETVGRQLIADFVNYGNCFASVDYIHERDDRGEVIYRGPHVTRISPMDVVFNPRARTFSKSPKIERTLIHVAELAELPQTYTNSGWNEAAIAKAVETRSSAVVDDWVEVIKERGLELDGFGSWGSYFKQDMVEVLIYRGDVYDPDTNTSQRNRVLYIVDRLHVIRDAPSRSPVGMDGLHHAGWRTRNDNLWAQGPLDNLLGMQYRVDHLENLKADVFDLIAHPPLKIKGDDIEEPEEGYAPGAVYYLGMESDVSILVPDVNALQANTEIAIYHKMMEDFAGAPPESRGVRTPGEKTAFEVSKLDANATMMFVDKARLFERMLETMLKEIFELMLINFSRTDYLEIFNDIKGVDELQEFSLEDVQARGEFTAIGARHWTRRNRETIELQNFMQGPLQDPKLRMHISGEALTKFFVSKLNLEDSEIFKPFEGVKEEVNAQAIAQAEAQTIQKAVGQSTGGPINDTGSVQQGQPTRAASPGAGPGQPGPI